MSISDLSYETFQELPTITSGDLAIDPRRFVKGDTERMEVLTTGGSTGKPKQVYYLREDLESKLSPQLIETIRASKQPILIHGDYYTVSYDIIDRSMQRQCPNIEIRKYLRASDAIEVMKDSDTIYLTEQVASFRILLDGIRDISRGNPEAVRMLNGKQIFVELVAEPVTIQEPQKWHEELKELFGTSPEILVIYGTTETLGVGFYSYRPGDTEIRYKVRDSKFAEVLDQKTGKPVVGTSGDLVITSLKDEGSILLRYVTGDQSTLVVEDGEVFLKDIRRKKEEGMLSFFGHKIFVPELLESLNDALGFPVKIECGLKQTPGEKHIRFQINLFSPKFSDASLMHKAMSNFEQIIST